MVSAHDMLERALGVLQSSAWANVSTEELPNVCMVLVGLCARMGEASVVPEQRAAYRSAVRNTVETFPDLHIEVLLATPPGASA